MSIDLRLGDCLEVMGDLPDGSVDLVCADLPYGVTSCRWDSVIPFEPLWSNYRRLLRPRGVVVLTASQPFTSALVMSNPKWFRFDDVWDKVSTTGFLDAKRRPLRRHESVLVFSPTGRFTYNPQMRTGKLRLKGGTTDKPDQVYGSHAMKARLSDQYYPTSIVAVSNANQSAKVHPTQKPVPLMEYLVRTYSDEGATVLDNAMGSGTTLVACVNTGRHGIGIERDPTYFGIAERRLAESQSAVA